MRITLRQLSPQLKPQLTHWLSATVLQDTCERLIGKAKSSQEVSGEVHQIMMQTPGVLPDVDTVASKLHMVTRSLRSKLRDEGTSLVAITDDMRCSLAIEYLKKTLMSTDTVALLLGFSEPTNFQRAFKRWNGKTTKDYRHS